MEILKSLNQLNIALDEFLTPPENIKNEILEGMLISEFASNEKTDVLANVLKNKSLDKNKTIALCEMLFQLNNYLPLLCNLTNIFLKAKKYDEIHLMVSKIFVAHIGNKVYHSASPCSFAERNFDRFIEIVKNCNIQDEIYMPFLIEIFKSDVSGSYGEWKRPALEYLQNFWNTNEKWILDFIEKNPAYRYGFFSTLLQFNTNRGVELLMDDYFLHHETQLENILNLVKMYKREILFYIDAEISKHNIEKQTKLVELMLNLDGDNEIMSRIKVILKATNDANIKSLILNKMGVSDSLNIRSEKQFLNAVRKHIKDPQERVLGIGFDKFNLKFKSGYPADDAVYSFLIYLFKQEKNLVNLQKLKVLKHIFEENGLMQMLNILQNNIFGKPDIKETKWLLRMIALLGDKNIDKKSFDFVVELCKNERFKEAKYLILCLIYAQKIDIISALKRLLEIKNQFIIDNLDYFVQTLAQTSKIGIDDLKDMLVLNNFTSTDIEIQRARLFEAFIAGKQYSPLAFKNLFIENALFNHLAQNLIFGEYRAGRLVNAFIVKNKEIQFLIGETIFENEHSQPSTLPDQTTGAGGAIETYISIVHALDCDFKFETLFSYFENPTFKQFVKPKFNVKDYNHSTTIINRFSGVFINPKPFLEHLLNFGFLINKDESETKFKSVVHILESLNIICEVEFENLIEEKSPYTSIGNVCFYRLSEAFKVGTKYITQKSNALNVSSLPYRYFDYILSEIFEASKNK